MSERRGPGRPATFPPEIRQARKRELTIRKAQRDIRLAEAFATRHPRSFATAAAEIDAQLAAERGPIPGDPHD